MKYISIDIETTGLNPEKCQILQIGAIIEDTNNLVPYPDLPKFTCIIEHEEYSGQPAALNMNSWLFEILSGLERKTKDDRLEYRKKNNIMQVGLVAKSLQMWLINNGLLPDSIGGPVKITAAGKNFASFDKQFLQRLPGWGSAIQIRQRIIDPAVMLTNWKTDDALPNLNTCIKRLGLDGEVSHDALADAWDVIRVLRKATDNYEKVAY